MSRTHVNHGLQVIDVPPRRPYLPIHILTDTSLHVSLTHVNHSLQVMKTPLPVLCLHINPGTHVLTYINLHISHVIHLNHLSTPVGRLVGCFQVVRTRGLDHTISMLQTVHRLVARR